MKKATKKESGAQGKKRRRAEAEQARREAEERGVIKAVYLAAVAEIGDPPIDSVELAAWGQRIVAAMLHRVASDPAIEDEDKREKQVAELGKVIGAMASKAVISAKLARVSKMLNLSLRDENDHTKPYRGAKNNFGRAVAPTAGETTTTTTSVKPYRGARNGFGQPPTTPATDKDKS